MFVELNEYTLYLKQEYLNDSIIYVEFNGHYTVEDMLVAQEQFQTVIGEKGDQVITIFDFRTASMAFHQVDMKTWRLFKQQESEAIKGYVLIGKSMFLSVYGNLVMRRFGTNLTYARTLKQAMDFAEQLLANQSENHAYNSH